MGKFSYSKPGYSRHGRWACVTPSRTMPARAATTMLRTRTEVSKPPAFSLTRGAQSDPEAAALRLRDPRGTSCPAAEGILVATRWEDEKNLNEWCDGIAPHRNGTSRRCPHRC